ncbi:MAG: hypothetical protein ACK5LT_06020 [Lachnospirales bacterium]
MNKKLRLKNTLGVILILLSFYITYDTTSFVMNEFYYSKFTFI